MLTWRLVRSRRTPLRGSSPQSSNRALQMPCMTLRPASQICEVPFDRSNSSAPVRYVSKKKKGFYSTGYQQGLQWPLQPIMDIRQLGRAKIAYSRSKSVTAKKQSSSSFPSLSSPASTKSSNGMHLLQECPHASTTHTNPPTPQPDTRTRKEVLGPTRPDPCLPTYPSPPQTLEPLAHLADAEAAPLTHPDRRA